MSKKLESTKINMEAGSSFNGRNERPEIHVVGSGVQTYLWIGQGANPSGCYATLSGVKTLEKLAMTILRELGHKVTLS